MHTPSSFHRGEFAGDFYTVTIINTGDAPTSGPIVITDTLPMGLTYTGSSKGSQNSLDCVGDGTAPTPLTCTKPDSLAPGESDFLIVNVSVHADAPDVVFNKAAVSGGGAAGGASAEDPTPVIDRVPFGIASFSSRTTDSTDADYNVAGGHPFQNVTRFELPLGDPDEPGFDEPVERLKDGSVDVLDGFLGNPAATPRCPLEDIGFASNTCPSGAIVGFVELGNGHPFPLFNIKPDRGYPAQFLFNVGLTRVPLYVTLRPRTQSYGLTIGSTNAARLITVTEIATTFFGAPAQHGSGGPEVPFLSNPVDCSDATPTWGATVDSWEHAGSRLPTGLPDLADPNWKTATTTSPPVTGCADPALVKQFTDSPTIAAPFNPITLDVNPIQTGGPLQADQSAGLAVDFDFPQSNDPTDPSTTFDVTTPQAPEPKDITVKLPSGLSISPSSANGLGACSDLASDPAGDQVHYDNVKPVTCPDASKIGTAVATSPLLATHDPDTDEVTGAEPIPGDVYVLKPHPGDLSRGQDGKFRLLIQLENAERGVNFKLPGIAVADKQTGQLTATFTDAPQLPSKHLTVTLKSGPRASLATPVTCGHFTTTSDLVPWSTPETPDAHPSSSFEVGSGPGGSPCVSNPGQRPFAPKLSAGSESSVAGAASPFVLKLTREDGEQEIASLQATLPKGLLASLKGVPYCPAAAIAAASAKSGASETADPSCPAASQVGTLTAGAGPGSNPYYVSGKAYLAGPYKGAPLSFAFVTPAVAGPFDLGTVVVRAAAEINPETAQVTVKTDAIPQILAGVPLRLRSIVAHVDRPAFTRNPTNCEPMAVEATLAGASGGAATPTNGFQVGECGKLKFKPSLKLSLKGRVKRSGNPAVTAVPEGAPRPGQHRQDRGDPAEERDHRQRSHLQSLHPGAVQRRRLPEELDPGHGKGVHAAARRAARRPGLLPFQRRRTGTARHGRRPRRPDPRHPGRLHRLGPGEGSRRLQDPDPLRQRPRRPGLQVRPQALRRQTGVDREQHQHLPSPNRCFDLHGCPERQGPRLQNAFRRQVPGLGKTPPVVSAHQDKILFLYSALPI
jgi:hypothetical protein